MVATTTKASGVALKPKPIDRDGRRHDAQKRAWNARIDPFRTNCHGEDSEPQQERNAIGLAKPLHDRGGLVQQIALGSRYSEK